mmetsp:Transcript_4319/g.12691  ORF Transcript_4319/g.12691 Transcript_4319/m.12691 type:complete len:427 (+) Transcript_4319:1696-2976(+)
MTHIDNVQCYTCVHSKYSKAVRHREELLLLLRPTLLVALGVQGVQQVVVGAVHRDVVPLPPLRGAHHRVLQPVVPAIQLRGAQQLRDLVLLSGRSDERVQNELPCLGRSSQLLEREPGLNGGDHHRNVQLPRRPRRPKSRGGLAEVPPRLLLQRRGIERVLLFDASCVTLVERLVRKPIARKDESVTVVGIEAATVSTNAVQDIELGLPRHGLVEAEKEARDTQKIRADGRDESQRGSQNKTTLRWKAPSSNNKPRRIEVEVDAILFFPSPRSCPQSARETSMRSSMRTRMGMRMGLGIGTRHRSSARTRHHPACGLDEQSDDETQASRWPHTDTAFLSLSLSVCLSVCACVCIRPRRVSSSLSLCKLEGEPGCCLLSTERRKETKDKRTLTQDRENKWMRRRRRMKPIKMMLPCQGGGQDQELLT